MELKRRPGEKSADTYIRGLNYREQIWHLLIGPYASHHDGVQVNQIINYIEVFIFGNWAGISSLVGNNIGSFNTEFTLFCYSNSI